MGFLENIITAIQNVLGNKMRSGLTMLGIIIGIGAVIMITSIGKGLETQTSSQLSQLGLEAIVISTKSDGDAIESDFLTMDDVPLLEGVEHVTSVSPYLRYWGTAKEKNPKEIVDLSITGTSASYMKAQPITLLEGRFLTPLDVENHSNVVVIDNVLANKMFSTTDCIGKTMEATIYNKTVNMTIIGVTEGIDYGNFFEIPRDIYLPVTYLSDLLDSEWLDNIFVNLEENVPEKSSVAMHEMEIILSAVHQNRDRYNIQNLQEQMELLGDIMGYITGFVALVASISLIVGGIGVMNIMLVTVTERTKEIGIRKSIGATNRNIQIQFLIEAVILTLIGGIIGIFVGYFGGMVVGMYINLTPIMSIPVLIGTVAISSAIGIVFGVYPANQAAKLDPIDALRYE